MVLCLYVKENPLIYFIPPILISRLKPTYNNKDYFKAVPFQLTEAVNNSFKVNIDIEGKEKIEIAYKGFIRNAVNEINENVSGGKDILDVDALMDNKKEHIDISDGEHKKVGALELAFNCSEPERCY